jgi:hypothetical protein
MVEYFRTTKGYFYKLLKNGEKKRISQEKYNKKMIGGGKSQEEIINELKSKGKYDDWVSLGSLFGLTSNTLKAKFFLVRPYKYYDVDGNIVDVSMVQTTYRPDVDNIAVFKQIYLKDPTNVNQGKFRVVNANKTLSTAGLATCTGLAIIIGTKKFMTHLDANTKISTIINAISKIIEEENVLPVDLTPNIYAGDLNSTITLQKAKDICSAIGIPEKNYNIINVSMLDRVSI